MKSYSTPKPLWGRVINERADEELRKEQLYRVSEADSSLCFSVYRCNWDSKHIQKDIYRVSLYESNPADLILSNSLEDWESSLCKPSIVWVKLATEAGKVFRTLETKGFRYSSGLNCYIWAAKEVPSHSDVIIRTAFPDDADRVGAIGANAFLLDRLFLDPQVENRIASVMYAEWSSNCVKGLCEKVLVAEIDGNIAGFVSMNQDVQFSSSLKAKYQRIILIAVSSKYRGKGIGVQLVNAAKKRTVDEGHDFLLVGTSSINLPAQNLYIKCGFRPYYSELNMEKYL
jgi:ribosomal protein S18 acetylase RimI-like enzyme